MTSPAELALGGPHTPGPYDQSPVADPTCVTHGTPCEASVRSSSQGLLGGLLYYNFLWGLKKMPKRSGKF